MNRAGMMQMPRKQSGASLLVALILLVVLTLFALAAVNSANINSRIAGNTQSRIEATAAARQAIEQAISTNFTINPPPASVAVDVNNDGKTDYSVNVQPPNCISTLPIKLVDLDVSQPDDAACMASGTSQNSGIVGAGTGGNSLCSNTQWDVEAIVSDPNSGANVTMHQGIAIRVAAGTACS